jgi:hypothetical protein
MALPSSSSSAVGWFDLTQSVVVTMDVRVFNESLGLFKDASNNQVLSTTFMNGHFEVDTLSWSRADWIANVPVSQIVSVGHYHSLYTDWIFFCNAYFGYPNGFNSLFTASSTLDFSGGYFGAERLRHLFLSTLVDMCGNHVQGMTTASLSFSQVNAALQEAVRTNPFGNRNPMTSSAGDGFLDGDVVVFDQGTEVTLFLRLVPPYTATVPPTTDVSNIVWPSPTDVTALAHDFESPHYSQTTVLAGNFIKRTLKVPLVVQLRNLSTAPLFDRNNVVWVSLALRVHGIALDAEPALDDTDKDIVAFSITQVFTDVVEASDLSFAALEWIASTNTNTNTNTNRSVLGLPRSLDPAARYRPTTTTTTTGKSSIKRGTSSYDLSCNLQCFCLMDHYEGKYASPAVLVQSVQDFLFLQTKEVLTTRFVDSVSYYLSSTSTIPEGTYDYWTTSNEVTLSFVDASLCYVDSEPVSDTDVVV